MQPPRVGHNRPRTRTPWLGAFDGLGAWPQLSSRAAMAWTRELVRLGVGAVKRFSDLAIVLGVAWLVRVAFIVAIGDAHSLDVDSWQRALDAEHEGLNPYETGVLNWPPFWLQIIALVKAGEADKAAELVARHVDGSGRHILEHMRARSAAQAV